MSVEIEIGRRGSIHRKRKIGLVLPPYDDDRGDDLSDE